MLSPRLKKMCLFKSWPCGDKFTICLMWILHIYKYMGIEIYNIISHSLVYNVTMSSVHNRVYNVIPRRMVIIFFIKCFRGYWQSCGKLVRRGQRVLATLWKCFYRDGRGQKKHTKKLLTGPWQLLKLAYASDRVANTLQPCAGENWIPSGMFSTGYPIISRHFCKRVAQLTNKRAIFLQS